MHKLRTFQGGIATAQSLPRCPRTVARPAFSSVSSVTPIQSMYESSRHVTCSASAGDDVPEAEKYLVSTLIAVMREIIQMAIAARGLLSSLVCPHVPQLSYALTSYSLVY
jgi:hypothetical protein